MFNKIERMNKKRSNNNNSTKKNHSQFTQSIWLYVCLYIQAHTHIVYHAMPYNTHITSLLMPRHDDVYLLYLCTHSKTAGMKSNQMKKKINE